MPEVIHHVKDEIHPELRPRRVQIANNNLDFPEDFQ